MSARADTLADGAARNVRPPMPRSSRGGLAAALLASPLYGLTLIGRRPHGLVVHPPNLVIGDPAQGEALLAGIYRFAGRSLERAPHPPWRARVETRWLEALHDFAWLADLRALGRRSARTQARALVDSWIETCARVTDPAWRTAVLARRVGAWLAHADFLLTDADPAFRAHFLGALGRQLRHLDRAVRRQPEGAQRLVPAGALIAAGLCLEGGRRRAATGLALLETALDRAISADGAHVARSGAAQLELVRLLVDVRALLRAAQHHIPPFLQGAIDRATPMLRFFRHGDGGLALFNDTGTSAPAEVDQVLVQSEMRARAPAEAPYAGFQRLSARRTLVLIDVGAPLTPNAHRGLFAFEVSLGRQRIIVNCGAALDDGPWQHALAQAEAHSTLCVAGADLARPHTLSAERREAEGAIWLDAVRCGGGLTHARRLYLAMNGHDFRGADTVSGMRAGEITARFHLHPDVRASLVEDRARVLLRLADGAGFQFRVAGAEARLEESVYWGMGERRRAEQIVLRVAHAGGETTLKWALARISPSAT